MGGTTRRFDLRELKHWHLCLLALAMVMSGSQTYGLPTTSTGGNQPHNNQQPGLGLNYIVATQGVFPSRRADTGEPTPSGVNPYLGEISMFAGSFAPRGYEFANGQLLPISQYSALFALYGTTYGGDGRTTFALPDLRGRSAMHYGNGPGLSNYRLGQKGGVENVTLDIREIPRHSHQVRGGFPNTNAIGSGRSHTNIKPYQAINYTIQEVGTFPSRSADTGTETPSSADPVLGFVQMFGGSFAPRGSSQADGQLLPINSNNALFSIFGTTYGGDGRTTFGLPDLRGRLVMGTGRGPGLTERDWGDRVGQENVTLTVANLPSHTHGPVFKTGSPAQILPVGGNVPHENMQPTTAMNYVIALHGLYPSRNADTGDVETNADNTPFLGEVALFGGGFAPRGWALAQGQLLPVSQYQSLFSILGTTYGGDGRTTFALPDLRGRVPVHVGGVRNAGPGLSQWSLGEKRGAETDFLSILELPSHQHEYFLGDMNGDGQLTDADIADFVLALTAPNEYAAKYPGLDPDLLGDFTDDNQITNRDIQGFVKVLGAAGIRAQVQIPEPTSLAVLGLCGVAMLARRRARP